MKKMKRLAALTLTAAMTASLLQPAAAAQGQRRLPRQMEGLLQQRLRLRQQKPRLHLMEELPGQERAPYII